LENLPNEDEAIPTTTDALGGAFSSDSDLEVNKENVTSLAVEAGILLSESDEEVPNVSPSYSASDVAKNVQDEEIVNKLSESEKEKEESAGELWATDDEEEVVNKTKSAEEIQRLYADVIGETTLEESARTGGIEESVIVTEKNMEIDESALQEAEMHEHEPMSAHAVEQSPSDEHMASDSAPEETMSSERTEDRDVEMDDSAVPDVELREAKTPETAEDFMDS